MSLDFQYVEPLFIVVIWKALLPVRVNLFYQGFLCPLPFLKKITYIYSLDN